MLQTSPLTADELVATLIHTTLPTILVEGKYSHPKLFVHFLVPTLRRWNPSVTLRVTPFF